MTLVVIALITVGLTLLIVEVIFIPGTTVVGILGLIFLIVGVIFSYGEFGREVGNYTLLASAAGFAVALYLSFRKGAWKRFSLKTSIESKVNEGITLGLRPGDEGVAVSALRPMGSAEFNGNIFEVKTNGDYLAAGARVKVVQIEANDILVEPISKS
ncbi:MAG: NfeD family protein [Cyclobacteriaceae bacterium]